MFMRYYGGGVGHGDSAVDVEGTIDPGEVVYESSADHMKPEDVEEESDDADDDLSDPGESSDEEAANVY